MKKSSANLAAKSKLLDEYLAQQSNNSVQVAPPAAATTTTTAPVKAVKSQSAQQERKKLIEEIQQLQNQISHIETTILEEKQKQSEEDRESNINRLV